MRLTLGSYALGSFVLAASVLGYTYVTRQQFYLIAVNMVTNKGKLMALGNMGFVFAILFSKLLIKMFLGTLREEEWENLNDRVSSTFIDTLIAMTIFRGDFGASFLALFILLLAVKIFHWVVQDRVDYIERTPALSRLTYLRVFSFIFCLAMFDMSFVFYAFSVTKIKGPSVMLLFGFEFTVLFALSIQSMIKFFLNLEDLRREGRWDLKGAYVLYLDFIIDMFKLVVYFLFFSFVMIYYGMPFHLIRQMYMTFRSFRRRVRELLQYRRATANMHQRFPDATAEEIANAHGVCIVCREEMTAAKKLPCTHVLHFHCLRSWLERSQTCPYCTASVLEDPRPTPAQQQQQQQQNQQNQQNQQQPPQNQQPQILPYFRPPPFFPFNPPAQAPQQQAQNAPQEPHTHAHTHTHSHGHSHAHAHPPASGSDAQQPTDAELGAEMMMYDPLLHVEQIQNQIHMLAMEAQFLWQAMYMQQQMFAATPNFQHDFNNNMNNMNANNMNNTNPNMNFNIPMGFNFPNMNNGQTDSNTNSNTTTTNTNNTNNNNSNSNTNSNENTTAPTNTLTNNEIPRISSEDELLNKVLRDSIQQAPSSPPRTTPPSPSPSIPSSPSPSVSLPPSSPSASTSPVMPTSPEDEEKDSVRRRRLLKFSTPSTD